jgi:hypothetical protein
MEFVQELSLFDWAAALVPVAFVESLQPFRTASANVIKRVPRARMAKCLAVCFIMDNQDFPQLRAKENAFKQYLMATTTATPSSCHTLLPKLPAQSKLLAE